MRRVLLVTKLDRLARSTRDLLNTLAAIARVLNLKGEGLAQINTREPPSDRDLKIAQNPRVPELEKRVVSLSPTLAGRILTS
jgi:hypothetical protein